MKMVKKEYFFYEWLILDKQITEKEMKNLTSEECKNYMEEYLNSKYGKGLKFNGSESYINKSNWKNIYKGN